jgi:N-acetyl-anhydromuramyl-L-alanine amidase AmpD
MSPNCEYLRRGNKISAFVIHMTEGSFESAVNWCNDQKSQVSYHFIIDEQGNDNCIVMPENTAWHAGKRVESKKYTEYLGVNANLTTIGIALAGFAENGPTIKQITKCAELIKYLANYYNIKLDRTTVIPHNDIRADKICPGDKVEINPLLYLAGLNN